jgi:glycerone phosphate O-acyltransferase/fatty acyl-CoA reductase
MQENDILNRKQDDEDKILVHPKGDKLISLHFSLLRSLLECYWATLIYLISLVKNEEGLLEVGSYDKFYDMIQWQVESMYEEKVITHYEACSLQTIKNAVFTFSRMNFVKLTESQTKKREVKV